MKLYVMNKRKSTAMFRIFSVSAAFFLLVNMAVAQTKISVKAPDSLSFYLNLNEQQVNNLPCLSITLDNIPSGKTVVQFSFPLNSNYQFTQTLTLKKNTSVFYEIGQGKNGFKLNLLSETIYTPTGSLPAIRPESAEPAVADDTQTEISVEGKQISVSEFERLKTEIKETHFEFKKLEKIKANLENRTINVDQLRYLMTLLDTEESKLELLKTAIDKISDPSRLSSVTDDFFLPKNKEKAREIISLR